MPNQRVRDAEEWKVAADLHHRDSARPENKASFDKGVEEGVRRLRGGTWPHTDTDRHLGGGCSLIF